MSRPSRKNARVGALDVALKVQRSAQCRFWQANAIMTTGAPTPTVTVATGSTTSITSGVLVANTDSRLRYSGAAPLDSTTSPGFTIPAKTTGTTGGNSVAPMRIEFDYDGQVFEAKVTAALSNSQYMLLVDGQIATALTAIPTAAAYKLKFDLGTAAKRRITLILDRVAYFAGIWREPISTISFPRDHSPIRFTVFGDSWVLGTGATAQGMGYAHTLGRLLGFPQTFTVSAGGTGMVLDNGSSGEKNYVTRWPDVVATNPDVLVIQTSQNDGSVAAGAVQAALGTLLTNAARDLPNAKVLVLGMAYPRALDANKTRVHTEAQAACAAAGIPFFDTQNPALFYGSGTTTSPSGAGNSDRYSASDFSHPVQAGHDQFALNVAAWVAQQLGIAA